MNNNESFGESVKDAVKFMQKIYRDIDAMMITVEDLMVRKKFKPTEANRISGDLGNSFDCDKWLLKSFYRIYCPETNANSALKVGAIHILLAPPEFYNEPVCLCMTAKFKTPVEFPNIWNGWRPGGSEKILEKLVDKDGSIDFNTGEMNDIFPLAVTGSAFVVPLCSIDSEDSVKAKIVNPLLSLVEKYN